MHNLATTTLAVIALLTATGAPAEPLGRIQVGELESTWLESAHPYPPGDATRPVVASAVLEHPGATYLVVHFARLDLGPGDELVVRDPQGRRAHVYRGTGLVDVVPGFWSLSVPGDRAMVEIRAGAAGGGWGFAIDSLERGFAPRLEESICGADDKRDARCYQTTHPEHYARARSVGRFRHCGGLCTGSLVSCDNHFLTNEHCKGSCGITSVEVDFDYETPLCGSGTPAEVVYQGASDVQTDVTLDYWLLTLAGDPVASFGHLQLDPRPLVQDEVIYIPQHPGGGVKKLGIDSDQNAGNLCRIDVPNQDGRGADTDTGYLCDTEGGSSGSPVLSPESHQVIALHHFAGCENGGIRMENIGPELQSVLPSCSFCNGLPAPAGLTVTATQPNQITLDWPPTPGAVSYRISRAFAGCSQPLVTFAETSSPPWIDSEVSGGIAYGYNVRPINFERCAGAATGCAQALATGECALAPVFAGVELARSGRSTSCQIEVSWTPATGECSADIVYNVYRAQSPAFWPDVSNLVASCVGASPWIDTALTRDTRYHYKVRAEDRGSRGTGPCSGGAEDRNLAERATSAAFSSPLGQFLDGAESTPQMRLEAPWAVSTGDASAGTASFRADAAAESLCTPLRTPPLIVTAGSVLRYSTRAEGLEATSVAVDGGTVELSTDGGGTWVQLTPTPDYPLPFWEVSRTPACNNYLNGNRAYSGSDPAWIDASVDLSPWAGWEVVVRFLLGTSPDDRFGASLAWWVDEVRIDQVANATCGGPLAPPREVSGPGAARRFLLARRTDGTIDATFEDLPDASGYNLYQGDIGSFYSHGAAPFLCNGSTGAPGPGRRSLSFTPGPGNHYFLVTAWNGDPFDGQEGTTGAGRPPEQSICPPVNNN